MKYLLYALPFCVGVFNGVFALTTEQIQEIRQTVAQYDLFTQSIKNKITKHYNDYLKDISDIKGNINYLADDVRHIAKQREQQYLKKFNLLFDSFAQLRKLYIKAMRKSAEVRLATCDLGRKEAVASRATCREQLYRVTLWELKKDQDFYKLVNAITTSICFALIIDEFRTFFDIQDSEALDEQFYKKLRN